MTYDHTTADQDQVKFELGEE